MKMKAEHIVPLSTQVMALLEELRAMTGHFELLFPGRAVFKRRLCVDFSVRKLRYFIEDWRIVLRSIQGCLAVVRDVMAENGWRIEWGAQRDA